MCIGPSAAATARVSDPLTAFLLFVEPIQDTILRMTNLFGVRTYGTEWETLDMETLHAYFGILLLAGVYRSGGEHTIELWNDETGRPIFRATMSIEYFKKIHRCIRFDDKADRVERSVRDKLAPIRLVFDVWAVNLRKWYVPGENVTIDEQLLPYRGRCPFLQYIPSKPDRYGIKIWALCDSETSYAWNMQVYTGKDRNCRPEVNQGQRVVLDMVAGLENRNVTTDNFFTSYTLAAELKRRRLSLLGTLRKNRNFVPAKLLNVKSEPANFSDFVFDHSMPATMVTYKPKKNRFVLLLSTKHFTRSICEEKNKPAMIMDYNATKGGADTLDQMVGTFCSKRKVNRWPMALFCNILDVSAVNAFVVYTKMFPQYHIDEKASRRRLFLKELGTALVRPLILKRSRYPRAPNAVEVVRNMREQQRVEQADQPRRRREPAPVGPPPAKRARCSVCPYCSTGNLHSTRCDKCNKTACASHMYKICHNCVDN